MIENVLIDWGCTMTLGIIDKDDEFGHWRTFSILSTPSKQIFQSSFSIIQFLKGRPRLENAQSISIAIQLPELAQLVATDECLKASELDLI